MPRAALLVLLIAAAHLPAMAGTGVYDLPSYGPGCIRDAE